MSDRLGALLVRLGAGLLQRQRPDRALRGLLQAETDLAARIDLVASTFDDGVHVKHRLTRYHDFFVDRIERGERVLDVGCGKGELARDLAERSGAHVVGVDLNPGSLAFAGARPHPRLELVEADVWDYRPDGPVDVVVLSNVLEHIDDRVGLLRRLVETTGAARLLIRVPLLVRDWLVPLRRELGLPYLGDPTHFVEYEPEGFRSEMAAAGLDVVEEQVRWGEIWAVVRPRPSQFPKVPGVS